MVGIGRQVGSSPRQCTGINWGKGSIQVLWEGNGVGKGKNTHTQAQQAQGSRSGMQGMGRHGRKAGKARQVVWWQGGR